MKEVRLSIPVIGGITVIYTEDDITKMKQNAKVKIQHCSSLIYGMSVRGIASALRFSSSSLNKLANRTQISEVK